VVPSDVLVPISDVIAAVADGTADAAVVTLPNIVDRKKGFEPPNP
jgi:hypothetical protein